MSLPESDRIYLWTSLFHVALFEVVPGDERHKLGGRETDTDYILTPRGSRFPTELGSQTKGKFGMQKDVHLRFWGYSWNMHWI
jgi:hypothetical protein